LLIGQVRKRFDDGIVAGLQFFIGYPVVFEPIDIGIKNSDARVGAKEQQRIVELKYLPNVF